MTDPFLVDSDRLISARRGGYRVDLDPATNRVAIYGRDGEADRWLSGGRWDGTEIHGADVSESVRQALNAALRGAIN